MTDRPPIGDPRELLSAGRFGRFVSVGVVGAAFDVTVSTALSELGVYPEVAVFIGIEVAIAVMFLFNDNWTFAAEGGSGIRALLRRFLTSNLVRAGGIVVQLAVFRVAYRVVAIDLPVGGLDGWFVVSKLAGIGVASLVNYVAEGLFTWRVGRE